MSILNKYKRWNPLLILSKKNIWDFVLSKNMSHHTIKNEMKEKDLSAYINIDDDECIVSDMLVSKKNFFWRDSISKDAVLSNIGLNGVDNGFVKFKRDKISNSDYINLLTNTIWHNENDDFTLKLKRVWSNSRTYFLPITLKNDDSGRYVSLRGGFFQGFFKSNNTNYQVLPNKIEESWTLEFNLRPMNYEEKHNTLNCVHPNNRGIFFYIGTKSENKFLQLYDLDFSKYGERHVENDSDFMCDYFYDGYHIGDDDKIECAPTLGNDYYSDDYLMKCDNFNYFTNGEYLFDDINPLYLKLKDENDIHYSTDGYYEINTDNKFLFFNRTEDGFNTDTWSNNMNIILNGIKKPKLPNLFLLLNNTKEGYSTDDIDKLYEEYRDRNPHIKNDIINNAFALKINEDGSIGYRYLISSCENDEGFEVQEEYSKPNIVKRGEWNIVSVKIKNINNNIGMCDKTNHHKMLIMIYVNGNLKFISKELPMLDMRSLDELKYRQEGVAYNISLGGGTMGLSDSIWMDYYKPFKYVLPIEKYFSGTFIGDIKSFKFYCKGLNSTEVKNNYAFESFL